MRLVLDTNVVMELLHYRDPRSTDLMAMIEAGSVDCFTDAACLAELQRVVAYPQFARDAAAQQALYARYCTLAREYAAATGAAASEDVAPALPRCRDTDDQKFMELAARCGAALLVTRDKELLKLARSRRYPAPFRILKPEAAIAALSPETSTGQPE